MSVHEWIDFAKVVYIIGFAFTLGVTLAAFVACTWRKPFLLVITVILCLVISVIWPFYLPGVLYLYLTEKINT